MGNVSHRLGATRPPHALKESLAANPVLGDAWQRMTEHLGANNVDLAKQPAVLGSALRLDPKTEQFIDTPDAKSANQLSHRTYRAPFTMPEIA